MVGESKSMTKNPPLNHITIILHSLSQILTSQIVTSKICIETQLNNLLNALSINKNLITKKLIGKLNAKLQECMPVGCIPTTAVAVSQGGCLPQCMLEYTQPSPPAWAWTPLWMWAWSALGCGPRAPLGWQPWGLGLDTLLGLSPNTLWTDTPPLRSGLRHPPPMNRMTGRCKNMTFANFVCRQ